MGKKVNLIGERFGRLFVLEKFGRDKWRGIKWLCQCDCGEQRQVTSHDLLSGNTTSCGCYTRERASQANMKHGYSTTNQRSRIYTAWLNMLNRCKNPQSKDFTWYGGQGISVCSRWHSFENFLNDMGEPKTRDTLDRIDSNDDYKPENCRWVNRVIQSRNTKGRGIHWREKLGKWRAYITVHRKQITLGHFENKKDAEEARMRAKEKYHYRILDNRPEFVKRLHGIWDKMPNVIEATS